MNDSKNALPGQSGSSQNAGGNVLLWINVQTAAETTKEGSTHEAFRFHADLEGNAEIANVYDLYIDRHSTPAEKLPYSPC